MGGKAKPTKHTAKELAQKDGCHRTQLQLAPRCHRTPLGEGCHREQRGRLTGSEGERAVMGAF